MRLLTKSRFKLGLECPNKLYYTKKSDYANTKNEDTFLAALAQGGFQVEEYARMHYPNGVLVDDESEGYDYDKLWQKTQELLKEENAIIYEAAFKYDNLFIRVDILKKTGNYIELIEVKAKSCSGTNEAFIRANGDLVSKWKPFIFDVAFQKYVMQLCYPNFIIDSNLFLTDKTKQVSINGLNQLFRITKTEGNRTGIRKLVESLSDTGDSILIKVQLTEIVEDIIIGSHLCLDDKTFEEAVQLLSNNYENDIFSQWPISSTCKKCEFKANILAKSNGLKSGFEECFTKVQRWTNKEFERPNILDIWDLRDKTLFTDNLLFKDQLDEKTLKLKEEPDKISRTYRQWIQIQKELNTDENYEVFRGELKNQIDSLTYPLHFIDFETSTVALPFTEGQRPYEQIAFQFSHHVYHEDGKIEHKDQYINAEKGVFPNFDFVRKLKATLSTDEGSIFRYSNHENTVLNQIRVQLTDSSENDKVELIDFIESITHPTGKVSDPWKAGPRDMVDLWVWIKSYYYNPLTKGSNSIKTYLPASLETSSFLKGKYSQPISEIGVSSLNVPSSHKWLQFDGDKPLDPYRSLPPVFEEWTGEDLDMTLSEIEDIADGGAALIAYAKLQYTDMTTEESEAIKQALFKYCELDTLAMVMIFEHLKEITY